MVPKDSSSRKEEEKQTARKGTTTPSDERGRVRAEVAGRREREEEQDTRREFAEFWLGEHTSGHYRSLST